MRARPRKNRPIFATESVHDRVLRLHHLRVDYQGNVIRILPAPIYRDRSLILCGLVMTGIFAHIIRQYAYIPVTILANNVYGRLIAARIRAPYRLCGGNQRVNYYSVQDNEYPLENLPRSLLDEIPNDKLTEAEIEAIAQHTRVHKPLRPTGTTVPSGGPTEITESFGALVDQAAPTAEPIIFVKKFVCRNFLYIRTATQMWITRVLINDTADPLQPGDVVKIRDVENFVVDPTHIVRQIHPYQPGVPMLKNPRPFSHGPIIRLHPFHLPATTNPLSALMLVAESLF